MLYGHCMSILSSTSISYHLLHTVVVQVFGDIGDRNLMSFKSDSSRVCGICHFQTLPEEVVGGACWCQGLQCKVYPATHAHIQLIPIHYYLQTSKLVNVLHAIVHNCIAELTTYIQSLFIRCLRIQKGGQ